MTPLTTTDVTSSDATVLDLPTGTLGDERKSNFEQVMLFIFIAIPFAAILAAIPVAFSAAGSGGPTSSSRS